jgi:hypothetical protein
MVTQRVTQYELNEFFSQSDPTQCLVEDFEEVFKEVRETFQRCDGIDENEHLESVSQTHYIYSCS